MAATKIRWGDSLDDDDSIPQNTITGPDKQGIKTITEYKKNEKGEIVKTVTKVRVSKVEKKIYAVSVAQICTLDSNKQHSGHLDAEFLGCDLRTSMAVFTCFAQVNQKCRSNPDWVIDPTAQ